MDALTVIRVEFATGLTTRGLAAYHISDSLRDVHRLREAREITSLGDGRRVTFRKSKLDAWMDRLPERS